VLCDAKSVGDPGEMVKISHPRCACAGGWHVERGPADLQGIHAQSARRVTGGVQQGGCQEGLQVRNAVVRLQGTDR